MRINYLKRREFITLLGGAAATLPLAVNVQSAASLPLVAVLNLNSAQLVAPRLRGFLQAMRELGHDEGHDFDIVDRYADGQLV
jgi:putative ABC transport system substrate-binding protein